VFEIGNSLREARVRQGLDYPQVELATKIRARYVRALEEEQFAVLPAQPYVKGFLRTYADFLGLDGQLYVDEYSSRFVVDGLDETPLRRVSPRVRRERGIERKVVLLALAGIAVLTALVIVAWKFGGGDSSGSTPGVVSQQSAPTVLRGLVFSGPGTYLEIRRGSATGAVMYQGTLRAGEANYLPGKRFWIWIQHPRRLELKLDGKAVSLPARASLKVLVTPSRTALAGG